MLFFLTLNNIPYLFFSIYCYLRAAFTRCSKSLIEALNTIKRTYDAITFFIFIYHVYVQLKSGTSFDNKMTSLANKYTNK